MIGIKNIATYLPNDRQSNASLIDELQISPDLLNNKIGFSTVARKDESEETSDLCVRAANKLFEDSVTQNKDIDCAVVVTQNPDGYGLPHTSAIVHDKLDLPKSCAAFDIALGCSGYVYALSIVSNFMAANGMRRGLLFTADPYSKIIDKKDRNTRLLFGDGASVTLLTDEPAWEMGQADFGTDGARHSSLKVNDSRKLNMYGRDIFNFSALKVPASIESVLQKNNVTMNDIDKVILHQGSKYIVETIRDRLEVGNKVEFLAHEYGNTVSSSIPMILEEMLNMSYKHIIVSGFGVGLSWGSVLLRRCNDDY